MALGWKLRHLCDKLNLSYTGQQTMKKTSKFILILVVIGIVAYAGYRYYLPSIIVESLKSDQTSLLVPDDLQEKVREFRSNISSDVGDLPVLMAEANIDYEDLRTMLERLNPDEVSNALREMSSISITSADQVFDIARKHVNIEGYDLEVFRDMFVRNNSVTEIREATEKFREHDFLITMGIPVAKEVAKDLLESARQEIERRLDALESGG